MGKMSLQVVGTLAVVLVIATMGCATRAPVDPEPEATAAAAPPPKVVEKTEKGCRGCIDVLNHINFEFGKAALTPEGLAEACKVVAWMTDHPRDSVEIEGHTCDIEARSSGSTLGLRRAEAVKHYLIESGIAPDRITTKGFGCESPAVPNSSAANRKLNRRAVFLVTLVD